jgi:hypothetical protein
MARGDAGERAVSDRHPPPAVRRVEVLHGGGLDRAKRVENGTAHGGDLQDTFTFLIPIRYARVSKEVW